MNPTTATAPKTAQPATPVATPAATPAVLDLHAAPKNNAAPQTTVTPNAAVKTEPQAGSCTTTPVTAAPQATAPR